MQEGEPAAVALRVSTQLDEIDPADDASTAPISTIPAHRVLAWTRRSDMETVQEPEFEATSPVGPYR